jgi:hypothetical protein
LSADSDYFTKLFLAPASDVLRRGSLAPILLESLESNTIRELHRPFGPLVAQQSLSFCLPEPPLIYPESESAAQRLWHMGATATLQRLEYRNAYFSELCRDMSSDLGHVVSISLYLSKVDGISFSWHTDEWENVTVQIYGGKTFEIKGSADIKTYRQSVGDWLRIDPHEEHRAFSSSTSVHLSIGRHRKYPV